MKHSIRKFHRLFLVIFYLPFFILLVACGTKKQANSPVPEIPVVTVLQKDVPVYRTFVGEIHGEKDIPIRARVEGVLEGIHFEEGFAVQRGMHLYTIDPKPLEARVNAEMSKVAEARTMLVKAKSDLERYKPLAEMNAVSESDLDAAQAEYDAALSSLEAAKSNLKSAQIELGYTKIYSPISGIIGKTKAKEGDFVGRDPNPVILNTVSKTDNVKVVFFLTESEYLDIFRDLVERNEEEDIELGEKRRTTILNNLELILSDGSIYEEKGSVDFIDRGIDPTTGSMLVQGNFPNPEFILRPGLYAKVKIEMEVLEGALLVPQRCVMELQGQRSVYVVNDSSIVQARQVIAGQRVDDYWVISEGLEPDEKIVIDALQKVKTGMQISPVPTEFQSQTTQQ